jgi:hypothetical protein
MASPNGIETAVQAGFGRVAEGFCLIGCAAGYVAFVALVVPPSLVYRAAEAASRVMSSYRAR